MNDERLEKFKKAVRGKVVVFIDVANLERSVQAMWVNPKDIPDKFRSHQADKLCWRVDYRGFKKFFKENCNLQEICFYSPRFGTDNHEKFLTFIKKIGFNLVTKSLKEYGDHSEENPHRKANFDVEIAVDAMCFLNNYDTFILFSGDCDFEYLLKILRGQNKICITFSRKGHIAKELPPASNYYFDVVDFRQELLRIRPKNAKNPA